MELSKNLRVLIDCSTFLSGVYYPLGKPHRILDFWIEKKYDLYLTKEIYLEYQNKVKEIAKRLKKDTTKGQLWFKLLDKKAIFIEAKPLSTNPCRDLSDLKYLEAAKAAEADFLISSDKDLLVLKKIGKTKIVTPDEFLSLIEKLV